MIAYQNHPLAKYTSFNVGGNAEKLVICDDSDELYNYIDKADHHKITVLGYGTNVLISDHGLPGTTILTRSNNIKFKDDEVTVDAGLWWDDFVKAGIDKNLYGIELTSGVPGGVGGAIFINITAYGQSANDNLKWIECVDPKTGKVFSLKANDLDWGYKKSYFQKPENLDIVILRACFKLSKIPTQELSYQSALDVACELGLDANDLKNRRKIILESRSRAGSLFEYGKGYEKTVGSFFRNPMVTKEQADHVMSFDESGKTKDQIEKMNKIHGGDMRRVSAAHVMLACGFYRGQSWGDVRLHPKNLLKIENIGSATAQQIFDVSQEIKKTVKQTLDIELEPEAQILGKFK